MSIISVSGIPNLSGMAAKKQRLESEECVTASHSITPVSRKPSSSAGMSHIMDDIEMDESEASILQNNIYAPLANEPRIPSHTKTTLSKDPTPPPITIDSNETVKIKDLLKSFEHYSDTNIRTTKNGIKLFVKTVEQYKKLKAFCITKQLKFFSHLLKEEQKIKIVLYGLHEMDNNEILAELKSHRVTPCDIKKIQIKNRRYDSQCIYLLYFKKTEGIKISELREIKSISHMIVKFDYYHRNKNGPTQCSNCLKFGHGAVNCYLDSKCIRCGEIHKSKDCKHLQDQTGKIPEKSIKCANCGENHTANYHKCKSRMEHINSQRRHLKISTPRISAFKPAPELNNSNFPNIKTYNNKNHRAWNKISTHGNNIPSQNHNDLLNGEELMEAFEELWVQLKGAQTIQQQIRAVAQVTIKYCYGNRK